MKYRLLFNIKKKFLKIFKTKKKLVRNYIVSYVGKVQFLMLNGEKVDISYIVEHFVKRQEKYKYRQLIVSELRYNKCFTSLMFAVTKEDLELVSEEIEKIDVNKQDDKGYTALMYACRFNKNEDVVKFLLRRGANVNIKSYDGKIALDFAKDNGNNNIVNLVKRRIRGSEVVIDMEDYKKVRFNLDGIPSFLTF